MCPARRVVASRKRVSVGPRVTAPNLSSPGLFLGPADHADVVVDFSQFGGRTLILYNDWPACEAGTDRDGAPAPRRVYGPINEIPCGSR